MSYLDARYTLETDDARYAWMNRMVCVATGQRRAASVMLEIYEVK